ncbi:MAG: hypothetical protein ACSHWU_11805 [Marinicella sp.]
MNQKQIIVWILAGFLITYHTVKIYTGLAASGDAAAVFSEGHFQNIVRLWIIFSLMLVIMFKRVGLYSMWLSISVLVVIQYIQMSSAEPWLTYLAPLKGFIFPIIITLIFAKNAAKRE